MSRKQNENINDRRVLKTKKSIQSALFQLMEHKTLEEISVTELAAAADINRKTFYSHYSSVSDVLDEIMEDTSTELFNLIHELEPEFDIISPNIIFKFLKIIFQDGAHTLAAIMNSKNCGLLMQKISQAVSQAILEGLSSNSEENTIDKRYFPYIASFISTSITSTFFQWSSSERKLSLEEVTALLSSLITTGLSCLI